MQLLKRQRINPIYGKKKIKKSSIFVFLMLLYPVLQFLIMWLFVNINSILLSFKTMYRGELQFVKIDNLFVNFVNFFKSLKQDVVKEMLLASSAYLVVSCFVTLPISLIFSYFIFKKIAGAGFFKAIFYLPSILPLVVLTLVYKLTLSKDGLLGPLFNSLGINGLFIGDSAKWMVWLFCIWAGIGYDVILLTSGMSRIPKEILESCKMDGIPPVKEFIKIVIPLTWPTITTLFIFGMMSVFNVYLQPFFLTSGQYQTMTIGLKIYQESGGAALNSPATLGLVCSLIGAPIIFSVRYGLNKMYGDVSF